MTEFEITSDKEDLGVVRMANGNVEKFCANFGYFFGAGVILASVTASVTSDDAVTNDFGMTNDHKTAVWYVQASNIDSEFDLTLTVTTNDGQTLNYSLHYVVGA